MNSQELPSTLEEYNNLNLPNDKPSFQEFGNADKNDIHDLCGYYHLSPAQRIKVKDVWRRHSAQKKQAASQTGMIKNYHYLLLYSLSLSLSFSSSLLSTTN